MSGRPQARKPQQQQQQQRERAPAQQKEKKEKTATGFFHPSLSPISLFEPAPLSPHPDVDRYLPKVLVGSIVAVTGLMSLIELAQMYFLGDGEGDEDFDEGEGDDEPAPQFSRKIIVHDKPIPIENWPRNVSGKLVFQPTYDWQDVPEDCVCPAGLEYQLDQQTGRRLARAIRKK